VANQVMDEPTPRMVNEAFIEKMASGDDRLVKEAQDAINDYVRVRMREDGFWRRILPPVTITNDELDRQVDTDKPVKVVDKEPASPAAISVPFATLPLNRYIRGPRFRVMFDRILTPKFTKDVDELRTYDMDIRQILSDNSIKDMLAEEDGKAILTVNTLLVGPGIPNPDTGVVQHVVISGGITRDNLAEAMKTLPRTPNHLNVATVLVNNVTIWDVVKFGRDEVGGDLSQDMFENGFSERDLMGRRWIVTIKRDLVPDSTIFLFAAPKFLGKFFVLEDTTMYVDRRAFMLEFFAYESIGSSIANTAAIGRVDFTP
jgi:WD40 repeat protein